MNHWLPVPPFGCQAGFVWHYPGAGTAQDGCGACSTLQARPTQHCSLEALNACQAFVTLYRTHRRRDNAAMT